MRDRRQRLLRTDLYAREGEKMSAELIAVIVELILVIAELIEAVAN